MTRAKLLIALSCVAVIGGGWWYAYVHQNDAAIESAEVPAAQRQTDEAPNLPKPPSFVERVLKDNPQLDRATAERFEQERIQINIAHQEHRMDVIRKAGKPGPDELIKIEVDLAKKLDQEFKALEKQYGITMKQNPQGFVGAPVPPPLPLPQ